MPAVAEATDIRTPSSGEQIFRTRCSSCHSLGDAGPNGAGGIGPDLLGVTRQRDPRWLVRWLKEPDRMLAEKTRWPCCCTHNTKAWRCPTCAWATQKSRHC